jgi:hypothetical protein
METGASDSIYTTAAGIPSYGINGVGIDQDDIRAHGKDERVRARCAASGGLDFCQWAAFENRMGKNWASGVSAASKLRPEIANDNRCAWEGEKDRLLTQVLKAG